MNSKNAVKHMLHPTVLELPQIPLLHPPIHIITVGAITRPQILLYRNESLSRNHVCRRHTDSILQSLSQRYFEPAPAPPISFKYVLLSVPFAFATPISVG